jgi:hypothetical protein
LQKENWVLRTGLIWRRKETSGGLLWTR